ncbi:MAG: hypothetical protein ACTSQP_23460 [Promethearchaeota archaeon]
MSFTNSCINTTNEWTKWIIDDGITFLFIDILRLIFQKDNKIETRWGLCCGKWDHML